MTGHDDRSHLVPTPDLAASLESWLAERYGVLVVSDDLRQVLGYKSMDAFRQALSRGTVPVPVFSVAHRRGKFALAKDLATWLADQRNRADGSAASRIEEEDPAM